MTVHDVSRRLPDVPALRERCRALAMLDAVLCPDDWESRYHSFNARWGDGEAVASMRKGSGDEYAIVFSAAGAYVRGFDHEAPMSPYRNDGEPWPGVLDEVPEAFRRYVEEPAFTDEEDVPVVTACLWRGQTDETWRHGAIDFPEGADDPDGTTRLFGLLVDGSPEAFRRFAEDYWEVPVDLAAVRRVFALEPLDQGLVSLLNPEADLADLARDAAEIGYPLALAQA